MTTRRSTTRGARRLGLACCLFTLYAVTQTGLAQDGATPTETPLAALRLAHLSPDAPLVDLLVDDRLTLRDVAFQSVSGYLLVPAGRHDLKVFPHRAATAPNTPQTDADPAASQPQDSQTAPQPVRQPAPQPSSQTPPPPAGDADPDAPLRVARLEPFTLSVDLAAGGYYTVSMAGYFDPPAAQTAGGSLKVEVAAGTSVQITGPRSFSVALEQSQTLDRLEPGRYTVTASRQGFRSARYQLRVNPGEVTTLPIDLQQGDGDTTPDLSAPAVAAPVWHRSQLQLYKDEVSLPPAGQVLVRVVHAAPGVEAVTVSAQAADSVTPGLSATDPAATDTTTDTATDTATPVVSDLAFPNASAYLALAAGPQTLHIRLAGTDFVLASLADLDLLPGAVYTLYLVGTLNDQFLSPLPTVDAVLRGPLSR